MRKRHGHINVGHGMKLEQKMKKEIVDKDVW